MLYIYTNHIIIINVISGQAINLSSILITDKRANFTYL